MADFIFQTWLEQYLLLFLNYDLAIVCTPPTPEVNLRPLYLNLGRTCDYLNQ